MGNVASGSYPSPAAPAAPKPIKPAKKTADQIIAEAVAEDQND